MFARRIARILFEGGQRGRNRRPPCAKGAGCAIAQTGGLWPCLYIGLPRKATIPPSRLAPCHLPLHKGGFSLCTHNMRRGGFHIRPSNHA